MYIYIYKGARRTSHSRMVYPTLDDTRLTNRRRSTRRSRADHISHARAYWLRAHSEMLIQEECSSVIQLIYTSERECSRPLHMRRRLSLHYLSHTHFALQRARARSGTHIVYRTAPQSLLCQYITVVSWFKRYDVYPGLTDCSLVLIL